MSRVPRIRFKGFEEDWEQRKLSEIYKNICNAYVGTATPYYVEDGHFYLEANNVKDGKINYNSQIFINDNFYESQKDKWLTSGDIVMVQSGHVGHAAVIPEELENTVAHALIIFKNAKIKIEPYFLNYQYQTLNFKRKIENITVGNTIKHILASDMKECMVYVSRFAEQIIVSKYFQTLDHLITLHQRKLEKLKIIKKSMLENLFPQNGEKTPKIRFSGYTKDWEQRKLSEIAFRVSNLRLSSSDLPCVEYEDVVSEAGILNNDIRSKKVVKAGILFDDTHVLYGKLRPYLHNWLCPDFSGVAVGDWWVLKPCYVAREFIYRIIQTKRFDNATNQSSGSKMPRADWNLVSNTEFMISSDSSEQEKIGLYFKKLDHLITLHQSKLEKLQKIKKSMLESMFV